MIPLRRTRSYRRSGIDHVSVGVRRPALARAGLGIVRGVSALAAAALGSLNPCPVCGTAVSGTPVCDSCDALLLRALNGSRPQGASLWLGPYAGPLLRLVHALKFGGQRTLADYLGRLLAQQASRAGWRADCVANVPASLGKLRARGFDQAALLARSAAAEARIPFLPLLTRDGSGAPRGSQLALGRAARSANAAGAYIASADAAGRSVLLVDDVMTSGATLAACRAALEAAGAVVVHAAVVARTVRNESDQMHEDEAPASGLQLHHDDDGSQNPEQRPYQHLGVRMAE